MTDSINSPEVDAVLDVITSERKRLGISERAMAMSAGLDIAGVNRIFNRINVPKLETLILLGNVVGKKVQISCK